MKKHTDMQRKPEDEPTLDNYPTLSAWLTKINARCLWRADTASSLRAVEAWSAHGAVFLIVMYERGRGWSIFTDCNSNDIPFTLLDAERRIGFIGDASMVNERHPQDIGLPINPPAQPYIPLAELMARSAAVRVENIISVPTASGIAWFWTHPDRTWAVGPYVSRYFAQAARARFLKLDNGPIIRHAWTV